MKKLIGKLLYKHVKCGEGMGKAVSSDGRFSLHTSGLTDKQIEKLVDFAIEQHVDKRLEQHLNKVDEIVDAKIKEHLEEKHTRKTRKSKTETKEK